MKLLIFSDLHGDMDACREVIEKSKAADVVIGAGDFALFRQNLMPAIQALSVIDIPALLVFGNHESPEELARAIDGWKTAILLHGTATHIREVPFFGIGGATPVTPFGNWSVDVSEDNAAGLLKQAPAHTVLITHSPPYGHLDAAGGRHLGSRSILSCIKTVQPRLAVCGHIHESFGRQVLIGTTPVINPGPRGMLVDLEGVHSRP